MTDTRKTISIKLPVGTWRKAKVAAASAGVPVWVWIVNAIEWQISQLDQ